jgi:F0F1-type ATP synthase assembly protein I
MGLQDDIDDLDKKIDQISKDLNVELDSAPKRKEGRELEVVKSSASAGVEFAAAVIICTLVGVALDRHFDTKPLLMLILMLVGCVVAFYNLYKASQEL